MSEQEPQPRGGDHRRDRDGDFGPSGYLPERASKRARKIVLRAPLGMQWLIAVGIAGVAVVVAGVLFLSRSGDPPPAPFVAVAPVSQLEQVQLIDDVDVLLTTVGRMRAFTDAAARELAYCDATGHIESPDGGVWALTGRGFDGTPSLALHPTVVHDGVVYLDPTTTVPGPPPTTDSVAPACS